MDGYRVSFDILFWGRRFWQELIRLRQRTDKLVSSLCWNRLAGNLKPLWNKDTPESTVILNIYLTILPEVSNGNKLTKHSKINTSPCQIIRKGNFVCSPQDNITDIFFLNIPVSSIDFLAIFRRLCTCHLVIDTLNQSMRTHRWNDTTQFDFMPFALSHGMNFPACWGHSPKSPKRLSFSRTEGVTLRQETWIHTCQQGF